MPNYSLRWQAESYQSGPTETEVYCGGFTTLKYAQLSY
jgi:hypothetical protein